MSAELEEKLIESMRSYSVTPPNMINKSSGYNRFNRASGSTVKGEKTCWYTFSLDKNGQDMFIWGDWKDPSLNKVRVSLKGEETQELSEDEKKRRILKKRAATIQAKENLQKAKSRISHIHSSAREVESTPYLSRKGFSLDQQKGLGLLMHNKSMVLPIYSSKTGHVINLQQIFPVKFVLSDNYPTSFKWRAPDLNFINTQSKFKSLGFAKRFIKDAPKKGGYFIIGQEKQAPLDEVGFYGLAEGYSTGLTMHLLMEVPVIVCFDNQNIKHFIRAVKPKYPGIEFFNLADNDLKTKLKIPDIGNPGLKMAMDLKQFYGIDFVSPEWTEEEALAGNSDFNDYYELHGDLALRELLARQIGEIEEGKSKREFIRVAELAQYQEDKEAVITQAMDKGVSKEMTDKYREYEPTGHADALKYMLSR